MPPAAKKRKTRASARAEQEQEHQESPVVTKEEPAEDLPEKEEPVPSTTEPSEPAAEPTPEAAPEAEPSTLTSSATTAADAAAKAQDRFARFKALQARAKSSSDQNMKEAARESQRLATDPTQLSALNRKQAIAAHKLLKADVEDAGDDFERKRAWDWTVDESEKWDKRLKKKAAHRDNNAFQSYHAESNRIYKGQLRNIAPDHVDAYERDKMAAVERAAASGGLDIVETEDGELIAVDKDGSFYSTAESTTFAQNKPSKENIDRLVEDLRRAEDKRMKARKDRMAQNGDDGDVTYINEKNKQFNQKLARFYNKYTAEIRDSFERGTMI